METFKKIISNRYVLVLGVSVLSLFGVSFFLPSQIGGLVRYFAYLSICCNTIPLPTVPAILEAGNRYSEVIVIGGVNYGWILVAFIGAIATTLANLIDYEILSTILKSDMMSKLVRNRHYQASVKLFRRYAFVTLTAVNFIAFSVDIVRLIAISDKYPRWKYIISSFVGRFARYAIMAYISDLLDIPIWIIVIISIIAISPGLISWLRAKYSKDDKVQNSGIAQTLSDEEAIIINQDTNNANSKKGDDKLRPSTE